MLTLLLCSLLTQPPNLQHGLLLEKQEDAPQRFIVELNKHRTRKLVLVENLAAQAQRHAEVMAANHSFNHSFLIKGLVVPSGENIARGQRSSTELLHDWFTSPGHTRTMLDPKFSKAGVGLSQAANGIWYWSLQLEE